ncbi:MAG: hypothetical protein R3E88_20290 [Myxococcota bacterium]
MFHVCAEPFLFSEAGVHGLCVSLNTPVLNIEELPVGPARAAIVLFENGYGELQLGVGVRSIETRQVVLFSYQDAIRARRSTARAMEAATKFAEGMGFLFDDDLVAGDPSGGRGRAMQVWTELTDVPHVPEEVAPASPAIPRLSPAIPLEQPPEELELEELVEFDLGGDARDDDIEAPFGEPGALADDASSELWLDDLTQPTAPAAPTRPAATERAAAPAGAPPAARAPAEPAPPARRDAAKQREAPPLRERTRDAEPAAPTTSQRVALSKFRQPPAPDRSAREMLAAARAAADEEPNETSASGAALGRVALVRKRVGGKEGEERPPLLMRLLSQF